MANHKIRDMGLSEPVPSAHCNIPYASLHGITPPPPPPMNFIELEDGNMMLSSSSTSGFNFGELEKAIVMRRSVNNMNNHNHEYADKSSLFTLGAGRPGATLEMFPSWPIRIDQIQTRSKGSFKSRDREDEDGDDDDDESTDSGSGIMNTVLSHHHHHQNLQLQPSQMASGSSSSSRTDKRKVAGERVVDAKSLRRLAQNREAARKSRIRKKAYVQQLESGRIKLAQLEQDLQCGRTEGLLLGGVGGGGHISSGAAIFDMEYSKWLDDDNKHMSELRIGLQSQFSDTEFRVVVDKYVSHYDEIFLLKAIAAKSDIFHLITGMWVTPAERCFLWMAGFRPSDLIKMLMGQLDPLTEQQIMGICSLQHSTQQAEEALSQGLEQLQQSIVDTISVGSMNNDMLHMNIALGKLANLEGFVRQADNLRQQTLHQLHRILTVRQAARCFLAIGEYYGRLRALSSLWASRPRDIMIVDDGSCQTTMDFQAVQSSRNNF